MLFLIPIPIVLVAVLVKLVADNYDLKIIGIISNIVILIGIAFFIYFYLDYNGINLYELTRTTLKI